MKEILLVPSSDGSLNFPEHTPFGVRKAIHFANTCWYMLRRRGMKLVVIALSVMILCGFEVYAETPSRHEVQGGLAALSGTSGNWMAGFVIGYSHHINDHFAVTTDFRGEYRGSGDLYQWLAGPRYVFNRNGRVSPFVQALAGVSHFNVKWRFLGHRGSWSTTQFVAGGGFGLDIRLTEQAYLRPFQLDFLRQMGDLSETHVQYTLGMAFRF